MHRLKVFEHASEEHVREVAGKAAISVRWVDVNNGHESRPELSIRLVGQETAPTGGAAVLCCHVQ